MRQFIFYIIIAILIFAIPQSGKARNIIAFGYLTNTSKDANYDYLETMFPNSFANSLEVK